MNMMLPSAPKSFGRLTDVLVSSMAAIGNGGANPLGLKRAQKAVVILVDGLGVSNIQFQPGHAPFLNAHVSKANSIKCAFPSTTAASITSLATGQLPGQHSVIGYQVFDRKIGQPVNLLTGWSDQYPPSRQARPTLSEKCKFEGVEFVFCGPAEYENSGFTQATMRGARYLSGKSLEDRFLAVRKALSQPGPAIFYLYVPELDQTAHARGSKSVQWLEKLEELDALTKKFVDSLPKNVGCLLTADHGIVDVAAERHVFLDEVDLDGLLFVGGDPRVSFIYFEAELAADKLQRNQQIVAEHLHGDAFVVTKEEVLSRGWYGESQEADALDLMPDLFVIASAEIAIYHRKFAKSKSMQMIGQHGSISTQEMQVPLMRFGQFA